MDELAKIRRGNVAVALMRAGVILGVTLFMEEGIAARARGCRQTSLGELKIMKWAQAASCATRAARAMLRSMRAVLREVPESLLEERHRLGLDIFDEVWEGVLHMSPAPARKHQYLGTKLVAFFDAVLGPRGIGVLYGTEVHRPGAGGEDYRIPDLVFYRPDRTDLLTDRGIEGAPLAVLEIRSPDDETYDKLPFYAALGVPEVIVILPEPRAAEVYRLAGGAYLAVSADERGRLHAASIDARISTVGDATPRLRVECGGAAREI